MKILSRITTLGMKNTWSDYWFSQVSPVGFAVFRIAFGFVLLLYHLPRLWYVRELYTTEGYLFPMDQFSFLRLPVFSFPWAFSLTIVLTAAIVCFILGYKTRVAITVVFFLHTYFSLLERFSTKGYGAIIMIYALLLIFAPSGKFFSLDSLRARSRMAIKSTASRTEKKPPLVPVTMQRIMLWQLAAIYFFNVVTKVTRGGFDWFTGKHLLDIYSDTGRFARPFMLSFLKTSDILSSLLGTITILGLSFTAFGLLRRRTRPYAIAFVAFYHLFVLFTTTIPYVFSFLMFSLYTIAIDPEIWERVWQKLRHYYWKRSDFHRIYQK